jgi:hypothetical protein
MLMKLTSIAKLGSCGTSSGMAWHIFKIPKISALKKLDFAQEIYSIVRLVPNMKADLNILYPYFDFIDIFLLSL